MPDQQQDPWRRLRATRLLDPGGLSLQALPVVGQHPRGPGRIAEQFAQALEVAFQRRQVGPGRQGLDPHPGRLQLLEYRRRTHFLGTDQQVGGQRKNAFGGQLALVADARQLGQRRRVLAGGIDPDQLALTTQLDHPLADRATGADPALRQGLAGQRSLGEQEQPGAQHAQIETHDDSSEC